MTNDQIKAILKRRWALEQAEHALRDGPEWAWREVIAAHTEIEVPDGYAAVMDELRRELGIDVYEPGKPYDIFASYNDA